MDDLIDDLLNTAPGGFLRFSDDGTILIANATLLQMLGREIQEKEAVQGQHIGSILSPGGRVFYQTYLFPLLKMQGRADEVYLSLRTVSGEDLPVLINALRRERGCRGADPVNDCILVPLRQRSRFEDELLRAKKSAEAATQEKERALTALAQARDDLEAANIELEAQQEHLLELNARLHRRAEREALVNRIGRALRAGGESETLLPDAVTAVSDALSADRCYFAEYDIRRDWAKVSADWHRPDLPSLRGIYRISDFDLDIAEAYGPEGLLLAEDVQKEVITDRASSGKAPVQVPLFSLKAAAALGALGVRSGIGVALYGPDGLPSASLNVAMAETPRAWTADEVELVQEVATLAWSAVVEARLREKEHRIAERLQAALQPPLPPTTAGLRVDAYYRAALDEANVGGDFYDVFPLEESRTALVVADLSGKGLQAAAQIATVRHMLRAYLHQTETLAQALTTLNSVLTEHNLLSGFATLFVGAYDVNQRTLVYVNAGQEPGLVRRRTVSAATPERIEELEPTGPVLGGFSGAVFTERTMTLLPGDVIALFTDGLTEAGPNRKDQLGVSGMARIFGDSTNVPAYGPQEITAQVMQRVQAATSPARIHDDVCLLVACVQ